MNLSCVSNMFQIYTFLRSSVNFPHFIFIEELTKVSACKKLFLWQQSRVTYSLPYFALLPFYACYVRACIRVAFPSHGPGIPSHCVEYAKSVRLAIYFSRPLSLLKNDAIKCFFFIISCFCSHFCSILYLFVPFGDP